MAVLRVMGLLTAIAAVNEQEAKSNEDAPTSKKSRSRSPRNRRGNGVFVPAYLRTQTFSRRRGRDFVRAHVRVVHMCAHECLGRS